MRNLRSREQNWLAQDHLFLNIRTRVPCKCSKSHISPSLICLGNECTFFFSVSKTPSNCGVSESGNDEPPMKRSRSCIFIQIRIFLNCYKYFCIFLMTNLMPSIPIWFQCPCYIMWHKVVKNHPQHQIIWILILYLWIHSYMN